MSDTLFIVMTKMAAKIVVMANVILKKNTKIMLMINRR